MKFPDFFILGAAKCGTSSLHAWLDQHPEILMSQPKEPFFFEVEYEKGIEFYKNRYFSQWDGEKITGDARHRNLYFPYIPKRIFDTNPDASFLVILRHPVKRAFSHYWHCFRQLREETSSFHAAIFNNFERIEKGISVSTPEQIASYEQNFHHLGPYSTYLDTGYYADQLERYFQYFPKDRFKIILFEELCEKPLEVVKECCQFLNLDETVCDTFDFETKNESQDLKVRLRFMRQLYVNLFLNHLPHASFFDSLKNFLHKPQIDKELSDWLYAHYKPHNNRLEEIIGRKLDHWNKR